MVNLTYNVQDTFWQPALTHTYNLSILIGMDRFSYCIYDNTYRLLALRQYSLPNSNHSIGASVWTSILQQDEWLNKTFKQVRIGVFSPIITLLPKDLFQAEAATHYLRHLTPLPAQDSILYQPLTYQDIVAVFALPSDWTSLFSELYPNSVCHHSLESMLNYWTCPPAFINQTTVFVYVTSSFLQICVLKDKQLLFHNIFQFKSSSDFLYAVLLVYKQLQLDVQQQALYLGGDLLKDSEIYNLLYKYIAHVYFLERPALYTYGEPFQIVPNHFFIDLLSLDLSEENKS